MKTNSSLSKNASRPLPAPLRAISWIVIATQFLTPYTNEVSAAMISGAEQLFPQPVAAVPSESQPATEIAAAPTEINRTVPSVERPPVRAIFADPPTEAEIFRARIFGEPIVPMSKPSTADENRALAQALLAFLDRANNEDLAGLLGFLSQYPDSTWRASLLLNLGILYRKTGYFRRALAAWEEAWRLSKSETEQKAKAVADLAISELLELNARLGRFDTLELLFIEIAGRDIRGPATEKVTGAREGLWLMRNRPEVAFRCGPMALDRIRAARNPADAFHQKIHQSCSTTNGTSLAQVLSLANELEMNLQMAKRSAGAPIIVPAVVHWKAGHFAAITREENGMYL
ncbi:MAG TPA: hypothetical protein VK615_17165, partial [Candidatus Binatia bacterium]|nr:hypothetical protein [Candidatus Binatia bacterium]